jgi:hypothetical protein
MVYPRFQPLSPAGLLINDVEIGPDCILITARCRAAAGTCPDCGRQSERVHTGKQGRRVVAAFIGTAFARDDAKAARSQWSETKTREPLLFSPLEDEPEIENLPEPIPLTPAQIVAQAEADERDRQRRLDWMILQALSDNSMAVTRAMHPWHPREGDRERHVERVLTSYKDGSFLIDRLGAEGVIDRDLVVVLLDLRRRLVYEYGDTPATMMLIDRAVAAYQDFVRISGWTGNAALMVEAEFFGRDRPRAEFRERYGREGREIRGLTVEEYINRLGQDLIPLAERCSRVMREAIAALETLRAGPSQAVERSKPIAVTVKFDLP